MNIEYISILKPRISDINYGGHLGHIELVNLLHEVRVQFLISNKMSEIDIDGCALIAKQLFVDYLNQAYWGNELKICMQIKNDGAKIIFDYVVNNLTLNNITAKANTIMALINKISQKPVKTKYFFEKINNAAI